MLLLEPECPGRPGQPGLLARKCMLADHFFEIEQDKILKTGYFQEYSRLLSENSVADKKISVSAG